LYSYVWNNEKYAIEIKKKGRKKESRMSEGTGTVYCLVTVVTKQ
jgi:hypothetical protein